MLKLSKQSIIDTLKELGLKKGDIVLVHSDLARIGMFDPSREKLAATYYEAFIDAIGQEGTLSVPAYFYEYARFGITYDVKRSPVSKELGMFSRYVAGLPNAVRSRHPLTAIASVGEKAEYISGGKNIFSYGADSPWERLYELNAKMVFLGIDTRAMTFTHFIEHRVGVPYNYNKIHNIPINYDGKKIADAATSYVRYLKYGIKYTNDSEHAASIPIGAYPGTVRLREAGLLTESNCGEGRGYLAQMQQIFNFYKEKIIAYPYFVLAAKPNFVAGEVPNDGTTGPLKR